MTWQSIALHGLGVKIPQLRAALIYGWSFYSISSYLYMHSYGAWENKREIQLQFLPFINISVY